MKIRIEVTGGLAEDEVIIRCARVDGAVRRIQQYILEQCSGAGKIAFRKDGEEYFFPLEDVLFFETEGEHIYAHTADDAFRIRHRLYELEAMLPEHFVRASKSAIVNARKIYSISKNLAASSLVKFTGSHKQLYVSRRYYHNLHQKLASGRDE